MISPRRPRRPFQPRCSADAARLAFGLIGITASLTGLGLWNCVTPSASVDPLPTHPTSIIWLQDQAACEKTDRSWRDDQCWDSQHDPSF